VHVVQSLELHAQRGDTTAMLPVLEDLVAQQQERWGSVAAYALALAGRRDEAAQLLSRQLRWGFDQPDDQSWTYLMALRAETAAALGDETAATEVLRLLAPWRGHAVVLGSGALCLGAVAHYLALAARTTGDLAQAETWFREAADANDRMGATWAARRSCAELDRTLLMSRSSVRRQG
jgi:hypothetical protein